MLRDAIARAMGSKCYDISNLIINDTVLMGDEEDHSIPFYFYDGFAYCPNYNGKVYMIKDLPKIEYFVKHSSEAKDLIEEFKLGKTSELTPYQIAIYYGTVTMEGDAKEEDLNYDIMNDLDEIDSIGKKQTSLSVVQKI